MSAGDFDSPLYRDFPSTSKLTRQDLEELLGTSRGGSGDASAADEAYFEAFVDSLPEVRAIFDEHARMLKENEDRAARNLAMQPQLEALRAETQHYHDRALAAEAEWPKMESDMKDTYKRFAPSALHAQVVQSASRLHDQSEALASAFVDGLPLDTLESTSTGDNGSAPSSSKTQDPDALFTRKYRELRTDYHRLNLIADRWAKGAVQWE